MCICLQLGSSPSAGTPIGGPAGGHLAGPLKEYDDVSLIILE